jgi:peptidoglycan/LPS O-acetylase OafA/YrhL
VLAVMVYHCSGNVPSLRLAYIFHYGWTGVDLFFVLSGFLITRILLRTRSDHSYLRDFYARRMLRIWPVYFCLLAFGFLAVPLIQPQLRPTVTELCHPWQSYLVFLQNLMVPRSGGFGPLQITWSLCVEEQFYLVWPFVILFCSLKTVKRVAVAAILLSLGLRFSAVHQLLAIDAYHNTLSRLDGLALGSLAAIVLPGLETKTIWRRSLWIGSLATLGIAATTTFGFARWAFLTFVSLLFCAVMCFAITSRRFPRTGFLAFTGRISYGLYLLHAPAFDLVRDHRVRSLIARSNNVAVNDTVVFVCSLALAFVLAYASWKLLELPILSLKKYFEPRQEYSQGAAEHLHYATAQPS